MSTRPPLFLSASLATTPAPASEADNGNVTVTWYAGASVERYGYYMDRKGREVLGDYRLKLSMEPEHVKLDRLNGRAPFLRDHRMSLDTVIGQVVPGSAKLEGGVGVAEVRLSDAPEDAGVVGKIRSGLLPNVSVGAQLHTIEAVGAEDADVPEFLATSWEPFEVSAVPVGADPGAQIHYSLIPEPQQPATLPVEEPTTMSTTHAPASTLDAASIASRNVALRDSAKLLGLSTEDVTALTDDVTLSLDAARSKLFELKASKQESTPIASQVSTVILQGKEESTKRAETIGLALQRRSRGQRLTEAEAPYAREYASASLVDIARDCLRRDGQYDAAQGAPTSVIAAALEMRTEGGKRAYLAGHATSDFPLILADSARKELRDGYEAAPGIYRLIARQRTLRDYLAHKHVLLGDAPGFAELPEGGTPNYGPMAESGGSVTLRDYSSGIMITRRALVNDDLDAFMGAARRFGMKAARKENSIVLGLLSNGTSGDWGDGNALFASAHANIDATGAAPSVARLAAMRLLLALQTGTAGTGETAETLGLSVRYIIVPEALRVTTEQVLGSLYLPTAASTALPPQAFSGYQILSDSTLDGSSATRWFVSADPNMFDTLEYCYLEGESGVVVSQMPDWDTEGLKIKARLAFAAHAKDYRGLATNAGA